MDIFLGNRRCEMVCYAILDVVVMTVIDIFKGRYLDIYIFTSQKTGLPTLISVSTSCSRQAKSRQPPRRYTKYARM